MPYTPIAYVSYRTNEFGVISWVLTQSQHPETSGPQRIITNNKAGLGVSAEWGRGILQEKAAAASLCGWDSWAAERSGHLGRKACELMTTAPPKGRSRALVPGHLLL